jgi:pSer/pThr/pTyr-binding forkhead associated (FHA) protein
MAKQTWIFGTGEDCDVRILDDDYVSIRHCKVTRTEDGSVWVEDLGSTNGTWVGSGLTKPVIKVGLPTLLPHGWVIRIGRTDVPWKR